MSRLHFQNYGTVGVGEPMGIRVLSGVLFREVLAYLLPLCNEDTGPVTPSSDISGCDNIPPSPTAHTCRSSEVEAAGRPPSWRRHTPAGNGERGT
ncbi:hypothetical protein HanHA300_Chr17g0650121 [Helianthus annuus]|nr:hypothetical protein HanHA300_Chr17g0650121 [Helianthus annuus]KAJ0447127.1 hypothetical protein HanHA89_Chr17g0701861 [Helianthus annuus]KAJ0632032.1 hypothetical protein HanLR1_Chr17g0660531 [Helianthus annuus]